MVFLTATEAQGLEKKSKRRRGRRKEEVLLRVSMKKGGKRRTAPLSLFQRQEGGIWEREERKGKKKRGEKR